jgi:hypothetical protein
MSGDELASLRVETTFVDGRIAWSASGA